MRRFRRRRRQCVPSSRTRLLEPFRACSDRLQYIGGTANTVPFDMAPSAVVAARDLIHSRMMSVFAAESKKPYQFNEVLSAAYMEQQSMSVRQ